MLRIKQCVISENGHCSFRKRRPSHLQIEVFKGHGVFFQEVQRVLGNKTHPEEAAVVMWLLPFYHLGWVREIPLILSPIVLPVIPQSKTKRQQKTVPGDFSLSASQDSMNLCSWLDFPMGIKCKKLKRAKFPTDSINLFPFPGDISGNTSPVSSMPSQKQSTCYTCFFTWMNIPFSPSNDSVVYIIYILYRAFFHFNYLRSWIRFSFSFSMLIE